MLVKITLASDEPKPKLLARHLRVSCYMSNMDASHIVNHAMSTGSSIIPLGMRNGINVDELIQVAEAAGFNARKCP